MPETARASNSHRPPTPEIVKSAVRVLEILEFFDRWRRPASIGKIAADLVYPQSSTSALMRSLMKIGYVTYDARQRTYLPTERVPLLGGWVGRAFYRDGPMLEVANNIATRSGYAVGLGRRNDSQVQWVHVVPSENISASDFFKLDAPLARSAIGLSLLATLADRQVQACMHRINAEADLAEIVRTSDMLTRVAVIRRDGHVFGSIDGIATLAMASPAGSGGNSAIAFGMIGDHDAMVTDLPNLVEIMRDEIGALRGHLEAGSSTRPIPMTARESGHRSAWIGSDVAACA